MKPISELANVSCLESARERKMEGDMLDPACVKLVDAIFIKFGLLCREYDAMYADKRRENAEKVQWVRAFTKHGLKDQRQIQQGIDKTEEHKWGKPPQLGQFLEWCKNNPINNGLPHVHAAFEIAGKINQQYSSYIHPDIPTDTVIKHVLNQIGSRKFREMTEKEAFKLFENFYTVSCRQYAEGEIKDIPRALPESAQPHPVDKEKSDAARRKAMEALRGIGINVKRTDDRGLQENPVQGGN